jgi:hypothetical protein
MAQTTTVRSTDDREVVATVRRSPLDPRRAEVVFRDVDGAYVSSYFWHTFRDLSDGVLLDTGFALALDADAVDAVRVALSPALATL